MFTRTRHLLTLLFLLAFSAAFSLLLPACTAAPPAPPSPAPLQASATQPIPSAPPTETLAPSPTPQQPRAILLAPPGADPTRVEALGGLLAELAAQDGLAFETRETLAPQEIDPQVRVVVILPPDPGAAALAAAAPGTQFLALGLSGLQAGGNLAVIGSQEQRPDRQGFLAGYLAAVITPDWRIGVIAPAGAPAGLLARQGFRNGAVFYCGLCRTPYPPFFEYPQSVELPEGAGPAELQAAADGLIASAVQTIYLAPGAEDPALLDYLASKEVNLIGAAPPPGAARARWIASITTDLPGAVREVWPKLMAGEGGGSLDLPLLLEDVNPDLLSPGRQRLIEETLAELSAGQIDTGVDPAEGASE